MNTVTFHRYPSRLSGSARRQRGVVLIVSLILLMVLTLIGVTAMQTSTLEERMAGNAWDKHKAFQAAEAALRAAENLLDTSVIDVKGYGGELVYREGTPLDDEPWGEDINDLTEVLANNSKWAEFKDDSIEDMVIRSPRFIIQLLARGVTAETTVDVIEGEVERGDVYRVTAIGWGATESTQVVLQSFYLANN